MNPDECVLAMDAFRSAYPYVPTTKVQDRQFQRLFSAYPVEVVSGVITDLIRIGASRPGPAEMGELLRTKMGKTAAGARVRHPGPYLDEMQPEDLTPPEVVPEFVAKLRDPESELRRVMA